MSFQAMAWAICQKAGSTTNKLVLMTLANYADDNLTCWPSKERLASDCECSKRTIDIAIESLEKSGIIKKINRSVDGKNITNVYKISGAESAGRGAVYDKLGVQSTQVRGAESAHKPIIEPNINNLSTAGVGIFLDFLSTLNIRYKLCDVPTANKWLKDNKTQDDIKRAVIIAKQSKGEEPLFINYIDKILYAPPPKAKEDAWWMDEKKTTAKGAEYKIYPRGSESWESFRGRIRDAMANGALIDSH